MEDVVDADALLLLQQFDGECDGHRLVLHVEAVENVELAEVGVLVLHEEGLFVFCIWVFKRDLTSRGFRL